MVDLSTKSKPFKDLAAAWGEWLFMQDWPSELVKLFSPCHESLDAKFAIAEAKAAHAVTESNTGETQERKMEACRSLRFSS